MPLDPLDPNHLALTPEQRAADKFATVERRLGAAERSSINSVSRAGYFDPVIAKVIGSGIGIGSGSSVFVSFTGAQVDTHGSFSGSIPTRLTAPRDGVYQVTATASLSNNAAGDRQVDIVRNHTNHDAGFLTGAAPASTFQASPSATVQLAVGEYVELFVFQNSGATLTILFVSLSFNWIGPS